jgi:hypothetical protein
MGRFQHHNLCNTFSVGVEITYRNHLQSYLYFVRNWCNCTDVTEICKDDIHADGQPWPPHTQSLHAVSSKNSSYKSRGQGGGTERKSHVFTCRFILEWNTRITLGYHEHRINSFQVLHRHWPVEFIVTWTKLTLRHIRRTFMQTSTNCTLWIICKFREIIYDSVFSCEYRGQQHLIFSNILRFIQELA